MKVRAVLKARAALIALCLGATFAHSAEGGAPEVRSDRGVVRGFASAGAHRFLGIPYAAPPVGPLRWRPPQPATKWSAPRESIHFGPACPQNASLGPFSVASASEDCLYLNVFAPADAKSARLPVMLWFYGGGLYAGRADDYDGSKLATLGRTVVVTINYRLGILGWFAQEALNHEGHPFANYGLMDQQLALQWIHANIAAFGGDPNNVTLFGQSSGGDGVYANLLSPAAAGLFHRGIIQSDLRTQKRPTTPLATAIARGREFAIAAGCADQSAACLRSLSVAQILDKQGSYLSGLVVDGTLVPAMLDDALSTGAFARIPLIIGGVRNEATWPIGLLEGISRQPLTASDYEAIVRGGLKVNAEYRITTPLPIPGRGAEEILAEYPARAFSTPGMAYGTMATDARRCADHRTAQALAKYTPVYIYEFAVQEAPSYLQPTSFPLLAYHTSELQFLFPLYRGAAGTAHALEGTQAELAVQMVKLWSRFAASGNPNEREGLSPWPRASADRDDVLSLNVPVSRVVTGATFLTQHRCAFWDRILAN